MPVYQPGDLVRLETTFRVDGTPTNPTTVTLTVQTPDGTETSYVHGVAPEVIKDSTGVYHADIPVDLAGVWAWAWTGTGAAEGVDDGHFTVARSAIGGPALCSLDDVKRRRRDATSGALDELIESLIPTASEAVMDYIGRPIRPLVTEARTFPIGQDRTVHIDDLSAAPTAAEVIDRDGTALHTLTVADHLELLPLNRTPWAPITHLNLRPRAPVTLDTWALRLTGKWGWPAIPGFVTEATVETVVDWLKSHQALTEPSPDQFEPGTPPTRDLPLRARTLLGRRRRRMGLT